MRTSPPIFSKWLPRIARHRVDERERVRVVGLAVAVGGAVGAHQAARHDDARRCALAGDAGVGDRAAEVQREGAEVDAVDRRRRADDVGRRPRCSRP